MPDLQVITIQRTRLFYDRYRYCISGYLYNSRCLRNARNHVELMENIKIQTALEDWRNKNFGGFWAEKKSTNDSDSDLKLLLTHDRLKQLPDAKINYNYNNFVYIYSNDLEEIYRSQLLDLLASIQIKEVKIKGDPSHVYLKKSQHRYRTYFREKRMAVGTMKKLGEMLEKQTDIRLCPSLEEATTKNYFYSFSNYFVDHNSLSLPLLIELVAPGITRKTLDIVIAK